MSDDRAASGDTRVEIWKAAQLYLGLPFDISNTAHAIVPIRSESTASPDTRTSKNRPKLEGNVIVHGPDDEDDSVLQLDDEESVLEPNLAVQEETRSATMVLVRMVNRIPLLDSAEAAACGLVQAVTGKKRMWNSFGLDVSYQSSTNVAKLLTFEVKDSEQVAPFFQKGTHALLDDGTDSLDGNGDEDVEADDDESLDYGEGIGAKRRRRPKLRNLLPASARLGNVLVIVQIHAQPSNLPLPTLSKGRLPVDNPAIEDAVEVALTQCLRQLQSTNPDLLLTASELRVAERDARYVPAVASALSSILWKAQRPGPLADVLGTINSWHNPEEDTDQDSIVGPSQEVSDRQGMEAMGQRIEARLRKIITDRGKKKGRAKTQSQSESHEDDETNYETELALQRIASTESMQVPSSPGASLASPSKIMDLSESSSAPPQRQTSDFSDFEDW